MNLESKHSLGLLWVVLLLGGVVGFANSGVAAEAKFQTQLVWATNDEKPPNEEYKPVDEETRKKLESLGLKWKNFFVVKRVEFETQKGDSGRVAISEKSAISVKLLDEKMVEVVLYGRKGEECTRRKQPLKAGEMLVHGGNVPENATAWLVTLKRLK